MEFTAEMIAAFLKGSIVGDKDIKVTNVAKIEEGKDGDLAFLSNPKYESFIYSSNASIVIVNNDFVPKESIKPTLIRVENAYSAFSSLLDLYVASKPQKQGVSSLSAIHTKEIISEDCYVGDFAVIERGVKIGNNTKIYPNCYIGEGCNIGTNVIIYSGVNIYEGSIIGDNVIIHSGAVIGADGFGFAIQDGKYKKIPQIGNVIIEADVEIGANTCIDRATMGSTIIKKGAKLDNLVQIAHNVVVGENCAAASQVGIAGSSKIEKNCILGGQVGIAGHITIAEGTQLGAQTGIPNDIKTPFSKIMGTPGIDARNFAKSTSLFRKFPQINTEINALRRELDQLKSLLEKN